MLNESRMDVVGHHCGHVAGDVISAVRASSGDRVMNKRAKAKLDVFRRVQAANGKYHVSQHTPHEQAIREHARKGFSDGLIRVAGLLDQRNKI